MYAYHLAFLRFNRILKRNCIKIRIMVSYFEELKMLCRCKREREKKPKKLYTIIFVIIFFSVNAKYLV